MPAESNARANRVARRIAARTLFAGLAALAVMVGVGACDSAAAGPTSTTRELINDVASRLVGAEATTYTANYALGGGGSGTITHMAEPPRYAYSYPAGVVISTGSGLTTCATPAAGPTCRTSAAVDPGAADPDLDGTLATGGLVRPGAVVTQLTTAALNANVIVSERETTYAGATATCVRISDDVAATDFEACVMSDGLLGSYDGQIGGRPVNMTLNSFHLTAAETAFAVPTARPSR